MILGSPSGARTFAAFPTRRNSLNFLRLILAGLVVVSHAWPIGGFGVDPQLGEFTLGEFSVAGFFAVSGWLITQSRLAGGLPSFAWRRLVRIYPGYLAALLVVGLVFAPVGSFLGGGAYGVLDGLHYVRVNIAMLIYEYNVGASLPATAYPAWNGSLWTLFSEAACYVVVGLLVTLVGRRAAPVVIVAVWAGLTVLHLVGLPAAVPFFVTDFLGLAPFFFAGAALFVLRRHVPLCGVAALVAAVVLAVVLFTAGDAALAAVPIAYLMMWLGARLPFQTVGTRHDISYGMYVYAFPVQQLVALAGGAAFGVAAYIVLCVVGTIPFAMASWFLVERPAQRLRGLFDRASVARHRGSGMPRPVHRDPLAPGASDAT